MKLPEITYSILEELRGAHIVDDERLDVRHIQTWVNIKRAEYLKNIIDKGLAYPDNAVQDLFVTVGDHSQNGFTYTATSEELPSFINTKYWKFIKEVAPLDLNELNYTLVNNNHFKVSGCNQFYAKGIFVTHYLNRLYFKSTEQDLSTLTDCRVSGIFEDPTSVSGYDIDNDEYPIDIQGVDEIKRSILSMDIRQLMSGQADEISDSSGEIKG